jgi:hypothetical protein
MPRSIPSPPPNYLVKLYYKNTDAPTNFALALYVKGDFFGFDGPEGVALANTTDALRWKFERLEIYADGQNLTFAIPTVISADTKTDFIRADFSLQGIPRRFRLKCHMLLLVGERQANLKDITSTGLQLDMYRSENDTFLDGGGGLGNQSWTPLGASRFRFSTLHNWLTQKEPFESLHGTGKTPAPLLEGALPPDAFPENGNGRDLPRVDIVLQEDTLINTLALVFRPAAHGSGFPLPVKPSTPSVVFTLPVHDDSSANEDSSDNSYRLVQRPSDRWLLRQPPGGNSSEEWLISLETTGFDHLWNRAVKQYNRALRTVRSVNRITLLPFIYAILNQDTTAFGLPSESSFNLRAEFLVTRNPDPDLDGKVAILGDLNIMPFRLKPLSALDTVLRFELGDRKDGDRNGEGSDPQTLYFRAMLTVIPGQKDKKTGVATDTQAQGSFAFQAQLLNRTDDTGKNNLNSEPGVKVRIGSIDLCFGGAPPAKFDSPTTFQLIDIASHWNHVPRLIGDIILPVLNVLPGGQDGLPASEYAPEGYSAGRSASEICMERRFTGSSPVVIPVDGTNPTPPGSFLLKVHESNPDVYSETVELQLLQTIPPDGAKAPFPNKTPRVIVLDSDPFLVAAVDYAPLAAASSGNSNVIALWNTGAIEGAAWQLRTNAQPFTLTLPPQGIGEEMPKAFELYKRNGDPDPSVAPPPPPPPGWPPNEQGTDLVEPLAFRFSPAARLTLQASYTPQNFTEAPWNLRRILGYPGQRDAGAGVVQLNYELLYGLSCSVNSPLLRLAEIFSLIGRIPGRVPNLTIPDQSDAINPTDKQQKVLYEAKRWNWSLYAELYSKRVALLEPRASGSDYGLVPSAASASGEPEVFTLSQGVACSFRGSADLYYSVDPSEIAKVDQDTFPIPHPDSALKGGVSWPFESARLFHATVRNPKSSSAMMSGLALSPLGGTGTAEAGFDKNLSTITSVTKIGRSSKVSVARLGRIGVCHNLARYVIEYERETSVSEQFDGRQTPFFLRPVLRKVREYIEILEDVTTLSNSAQTYPGAGCVKSIEFKQKVIPVSSSWSANVGDYGWKIPLWYEPDSTISDTNLYAYKRPSVVFNMAGADGADVECCIRSVDKLFFYTETDAKADPDPHNWPIVPGVDFLPCPVPAPNPAFPSSTAHEIPAYDPPTPFGLATFTHQLDPGHGNINLVNGRSAQAIGSTLVSVTLQRGPQEVPKIQKQLQQLHDSVRNDLFNAIRTDPRNVASPAAAICVTAGGLVDPIKTQLNALAKGVVDRETALLQGYLTQAAGQVDLFRDEFKSQLRAQAASLLRQKVDDVRSKLEDSLNAEVDAFVQRLDSIPASANAMQKFFSRICQSLAAAKTELDARKTTLKASLQAVSFTVSHDAIEIQSSIDQLRQRLTDPLDQTNRLITKVRTQAQTGVEIWMPGACFVSQLWETDISPKIATVQSVQAQAETLLAYANAGADDQLDAARASVTTALANAILAVDGIAFPQWLLDAAAQAKTDAGEVERYVQGLPQKVKDNSDKWIDAAAGKLQGGIIQSLADLDAIADSIAQKVVGLFDVTSSELQTVQQAVLKHATDVTTSLQRLGNDLAKEVCDAATKLQTAALNELEGLRRTLEDAAGRLAESIAHALPPIDMQLPSGASLPVLLNRGFGTAPTIPNLGFSLPNAAYFFGQLAPNVNLTPLLTKVKDLVPNLSPLSTLVPSFALSDRALPVPHLPNFDLNSILPDFAGLKLTNLFPSLKMPAGSSDAVKITHGIDNQSRTAWVQADIDLKTNTATIFSLGPMALQIVSPRFTSQVRAQAGANGQVSKQATGSITGDWQLLIGGSPMITLLSTSLTFDKDGKLHVDVSPNRVQLSAALSFIEQIIASYSSPDTGFGIYPSATGIETRLSLPIPDTSMGTTGITNLTFNFLFGLNWAGDFALYAGFGLASPNAPFNLAIYILGGGGHLVATARYTPGKSLSCQVDMALDASAALAISLGPIEGSVHVNLGMRFVFNSGKGDLSLGIFLLIGGEVSILSIVSANILLRLDATYQNGAFTCRGLFSISIKICWCFTLSVSEEVSCQLGSGGGMTYADPLPLPFAPSASPDFRLTAASISSVPPASELLNYPTLSANYLQLVS